MKDYSKEVAKLEPTIDFSKKKYTLNLETSMGNIELEFYPELAPGHCKNMLALAKLGYYDGLSFHRVIKDFVIQGGCPVGNGTGGPGYQIKAEFNDKPHEPGVLSMARAMDPDSGGSQFFLCLGRVPHLDGQYTVFGKTANPESLEVVMKIGDVSTGPGDRPFEEVVMKKVEVVESEL